jgi:hypothetical protein
MYIVNNISLFTDGSKNMTAYVVSLWLTLLPISDHDMLLLYRDLPVY